MQVKPDNQVAGKAARQLHYLTGDLDTSVQVERSVYLGFLTENTSDLCFSVLVDHLETNLDQVDTAITWLKSLANCLATPPPAVAPAEHAVCQLMASIATSVGELGKTRFPIGATIDQILKILTKYCE